MPPPIYYQPCQTLKNWLQLWVMAWYSDGFPKENKTFTFDVNTTTSFSDWRRVIGSYSIPRKSLYYGQAWLRSWSRYMVFTFMFGKSCGDNESIRYTVVSISLWKSNMLCFSVMVFYFTQCRGDVGSTTKCFRIPDTFSNILKVVTSLGRH